MTTLTANQRRRDNANGNEPKQFKREVIAIDGEGIDVPGTGSMIHPLDENGEEIADQWLETGKQHLYTLLVAADSRYQKARYIEDWQHGLATARIFDFLLSLRRGRFDIATSYYFNYDIAMWLRDVPDEQKKILWQSGQLVYSDKHGDRQYFVRYIPNKIFFVGQWNASVPVDCDVFHYPHDLRSFLVYDVSGFAQKPFVKAMRDWNITIDGVAEMKEKRGDFRPEDKESITAYCIKECVALCQYVKKLDETFQAEGIYLNSWHGPGALATHFLKRHNIRHFVKDGDEALYPGLREATLKAYFGGRVELFQMGHLNNIHDYDGNSMYPAATVLLPDLVHGEWVQIDCSDWKVSEYENKLKIYPFGLWRLQWHSRGSYTRLARATTRRIEPVSPFPFRWRGGIYYSDRGGGTFHTTEVQAAGSALGWDRITLQSGWAYLPAHPGTQPFGFVSELARKRLAYKSVGDSRAVPYKYAMNSMYGKLAQHAVDEDKLPPFQCYYAAGFLTAWTRGELLRFVFSGGHTSDDLVMFATDGVFCLDERNYRLGEGLGEFSYVGKLYDTYLVQPGCWFDNSGHVRTRGFYARSLDYQRVQREWNSAGLCGKLAFNERRFIGIGACSGTGDWQRYGRWYDGRREIAWRPEKKFPAMQAGDSIRLLPYSMDEGLESEIYVPASFRDTSGFIQHMDELYAILEAEDQPDLQE